MERLLGACLYLTEHAEPLLEPGGFTHVPGGARRWPGKACPDLQVALDADTPGWYAAERAGLVGAVVQAHDARLWDATWELADNLCAYLDARSLWDDWAVVHEVALHATRQAGSATGEAVVRRNLGVLARMRGDAETAHAHFSYALKVLKDLGDEPQQADTLGNQTDIYRDTGDYAKATACLECSLQLFQRHRIRRGEGWAYQMFADTVLLQGRPEHAHELLDDAEPLFRDIGDIRGLGWALRSRASAYSDQAKNDSAMATYEKALDLLEKSNDIRGVALAIAGRASSTSAATTRSARSTNTTAPWRPSTTSETPGRKLKLSLPWQHTEKRRAPR